jgi:hypothetical protein
VNVNCKSKDLCGLIELDKMNWFVTQLKGNNYRLDYKLISGSCCLRVSFYVKTIYDKIAEIKNCNKCSFSNTTLVIMRSNFLNIINAVKFELTITCDHHLGHFGVLLLNTLKQTWLLTNAWLWKFLGKLVILVYKWTRLKRNSIITNKNGQFRVQLTTIKLLLNDHPSTTASNLWRFLFTDVTVCVN